MKEKWRPTRNINHQELGPLKKYMSDSQFSEITFPASNQDLPSIRQRMIKRARSEESGRRENLEGISRISAGFSGHSEGNEKYESNLKSWPARITDGTWKNSMPFRVNNRMLRTRPTKEKHAPLSLRLAKSWKGTPSRPMCVHPSKSPIPFKNASSYESTK